nr:hypothetical protein CFP56_68203 [Quercus suber]
MLKSIIKDEDADPCVGQATEELGDSGLFDRARALVRMKALQVKGVTSEGVITCQGCYPTSDFSMVTMDEPMSLTLAGDIALRESDDSSELEPGPKDGIILAQHAADAPVTPMVPSMEPVNIENPIAQDT